MLANDIYNFNKITWHVHGSFGWERELLRKIAPSLFIWYLFSCKKFPIYSLVYTHLEDFLHSAVPFEAEKWSTPALAAD